MTLNILQIIADTGLCLLIWLVQLVIYPSFRYISNEYLSLWHRRYTKVITFIVAPLMLTQLAVYAFELFYIAGVFPVIQFSLIVLAWLITFWISVPLHQGLVYSRQKVVEKLIFTNWGRTIIWSVVWLISVFKVVFFPI